MLLSTASPPNCNYQMLFLALGFFHLSFLCHSSLGFFCLSLIPYLFHSLPVTSVPSYPLSPNDQLFPTYKSLLALFLCVRFFPNCCLSFSPFSIILSPSSFPLFFHFEWWVYFSVIFINMRHIYTVYFDRGWETYLFLELCCSLHHILWLFKASESSDIDPGSVSPLGSILFTIPSFSEH